MNGIDLFLQLPTTAEAAAICFAACTSDDLDFGGE